MGHTLTLEVPEELYDPLVKTAEQKGSTPEKVAIEWLVAALRHAANDPIESFIGAVQSDIADWIDDHDGYLGRSAAITLSKLALFVY